MDEQLFLETIVPDILALYMSPLVSIFDLIDKIDKSLASAGSEYSVTVNTLEMAAEVYKGSEFVFRVRVQK